MTTALEAHPVAETWLTQQEVADRLRVTVRTVYELRRKGDLTGYRVGRQWRYRAEDVEALITRPGNEQGSNGQ